MGNDITIFGGLNLTPGLKAERELLARAKRLGAKALSGSGADDILAQHAALCKQHAEIPPLDSEDDIQLMGLRERLIGEKLALASLEQRFATEEPRDRFGVVKAVRAKALDEATAKVRSTVALIRRFEASRAVDENVQG